MSEKPSAWTPEEKMALFAAVEQCRATGGQLAWGAIVATVPGRSASAVEVRYYKLQRVRTLLTSAAEAGASVFKMMEVSRHKSVDVVSGYVRSANALREVSQCLC